MESLMCCVARRRTRNTLNPLEGRTNLRLMGRQDYDDPLLEGAVAPHSNCVEGQSSSSTGNRQGESPRRDQEESTPTSNGANGVAWKSAWKRAAAGVQDGLMAKQVSKGILKISGSEGKGSEGDLHGNGDRDRSPKNSPKAALPASSSSSENGDAPVISQGPSNKNPSSSPSKHQQKVTSFEDTQNGESSRDPVQKQLEDLSKKLRNTMQKYPSSGKNMFFSGLKERFFAVTFNPAGEARNPTALCYWEDEQSSRQEEPLGIIPVSSITAVQWKQDIEKGLQVTVVTNAKDGKKDANVALTLKFASSRDAKTWSSDLQNFCEVYKRWSSSTSKTGSGGSPRRRQS